MALSASTLASLISANLEALGAKGDNLQKFCTAVATGIVESIVGKAFATLDAGLISGAGTGTGTGITGLSSSAMQDTALSLMKSTGKNASPLMQAIMAATVAHLATASLATIDAPVFTGAGTIVVGSIAVVPSEMSANIDSQLLSSGANGKNRTALATAIGTAICQNILSAGTGATTISGAGIPTGPGTGAGTGTIS